MQAVKTGLGPTSAFEGKADMPQCRLSARSMNFFKNKNSFAQGSQSVDRLEFQWDTAPTKPNVSVERLTVPLLAKPLFCLAQVSPLGTAKRTLNFQNC